MYTRMFKECIYLLIFFPLFLLFSPFFLFFAPSPLELEHCSTLAVGGAGIYSCGSVHTSPGITTLHLPDQECISEVSKQIH